MIAPEFRVIVPVDLSTPSKNFIETQHGHELWAALQPSIQEVESIRKELANAQAYNSDVEQLKKFTELFARSYQNTMLLNRYFSFGNGPK